MSAFAITQGATFVVALNNEGPLTDVVTTAAVRRGDDVFALTVTVTDAAAGLATLTAATGTWPPGLYQMEIVQVADSVTSKTPPLTFTVRERTAP